MSDALAPVTLVPLALATVALATACGAGAPTLDEALDGYRDHLAEVLGASAPSELLDAGRRGPPTLPRGRERVPEVPDVRAGLFDFFALSDCRLGALVAERNSPMGRQMPASQRLRYERAFLEAAPACLEALPEDATETRAELQALLEAKRAAWPAARYAAVWGAEEVEAHFAVSGSLSLGRLDGEAAAAVGALTALVEAPLDAGAPPWPLERADAAFRQVGRRATAGLVLRGLHRTAEVLEAVAATVEARLEASDRCYRADRTLAGSLRGPFGRVLAPQLLALDRAAEPLLHALHRLHEASAVGLDRVPASMERFVADALVPPGQGGPFDRVRRATKRHAAAWTALLARCGLSVQAVLSP